MDLQKSNMTVLAQIVKLIPAKIIDSLAKKYKIQTRAFSPTSHIVTLLYEHLAHSLSLNDVCDSLQHHSGMLNQIRRCTPPTRMPTATGMLIWRKNFSGMFTTI